MDPKKPYQGAFIGQAHYFALRVYIEDTDIGGVVYHANYLRFLERARSDMLRCAGIGQRSALENGQGVYAVTEVQIKFLRPARLDDALVIVTHLRDVGAATCVIAQEISRGDELLARATVTVAFLGANGRPKRHPPGWGEKFTSILCRPAPGPGAKGNAG